MQMPAPPAAVASAAVASAAVWANGSKAEALVAAREVLTTARVLPLFYFDVGRWWEDRDEVLAELSTHHWSDEPLIVRSSAEGEDDPSFCEAGLYLSVRAVVGPAALADAVDAVIASYAPPGPGDQVLIQPELHGAMASGVAFSCDPANGSPYLVVNWAEGAVTDAVTGGHAGGLNTWIGAWSSDPPPPGRPFEGKLGVVVRDLLLATGFDHIEIEFGIDADGLVVLFQVRSLQAAPTELIPGQHHDALIDISGAIEARARNPSVGVRGSRTAFGVMPDWNPAEIIGRRPRPLARSLYKHLITDSTWREARAAYGYRVLPGVELMDSFGGLPYIDVAASFTSLCPADLPDDVADRLVDASIERLLAHPHLHDKVEFEVVLSCWTADLEERLAAWYGPQLDLHDRALILDSLRQLTRQIVATTGQRRTDLELVSVPLQSSLNVRSSSPADIVAMLQRCIVEGTRPFAGLARCAFVARQILDSFVRVGAITSGELESLLGSIDTTAGLMRRDLESLGRTEFLQRYGHLRPGTYDVLSPRYDEAPDHYFAWDQPAPAASPAASPAVVGLPDEIAGRIDHVLADGGAGVSAQELWAFAAASIGAREEAKFRFSRQVSLILSCIADLARHHGLSVDDSSYLDVATVQGLTGDFEGDHHVLRSQVERGRRAYSTTRALSLPMLMSSGEQAWAFEEPPTEPNFITHRRVMAPVAVIDRGDAPEGAIAVVSSADPGYDWLFSRGVVGLVTAYGGCNSHMAVRSIQLGIPAVIGAGDERFGRWSQATFLDVDCANRLVRIVT